MTATKFNGWWIAVPAIMGAIFISDKVFQIQITDHLSWSSFSRPIIFLVTNIAVRLGGAKEACAFPFLKD